MAGGKKTYDLEFTPTWIVAAVCSVIIILSLLFERGLHRLGERLKKNQKSLSEAVLKVKEELMLMGFIAFLLSAFQGPLNRICIPSSFFDHMLPCRRKEFEDHKSENQCEKKGKEQLLSIDAIHQLHIFIFVLAITHLALTVVTIFLGRLKIRQWKAWENSIAKDADNSRSKIIHVLSDQFITEHYKAIKGHSCVLSWLHSFFKHFHASITKTGYRTLRSGFIMMHCEGNPQYDFHKYIMRAYEDDFKKVVGISWYHWPFVVVLLLMNVGGWQTLFWMTLISLLLLLAVGTKLEHVISQLAKEVVEKHTAMEGELVVSLSDRHFWFKKPRLVLHLIHFILLQNAFQIAFFFWLWVTYGCRPCVMGKLHFLIPRLIFGVVIQVLCSFSTLPIYAIVTQMGDSFNRAIFGEDVQETLVGWAEKARRKNAAGPMCNHASPSVSSSTQAAHTGNRSPNEVQLQETSLVHAVPTNTSATSRLEASPAKKIHAEEIAP